MSNEFDAALADIREALAADGFNLSVKDATTGNINVLLSAGPDACIECLVPDDVLVQILEDSLRAGGHEVEVVALEKQGI